MQTVTGSAVGSLSKVLNQIFSSFLKSLEGMFSSNAKVDEKFEKGKYITTTIDKPENPPVDENGKPLADNKAIFEVTIAIQWPEDQELTKDQAIAIVKNKDTWVKAKNMALDMSFAGKNKVSKSNLTSKRVEDEIKDYKEEYDILNTATLYKMTTIFLFNEIDKPEENSDQADASASTKMNVMFKKITSATETQVHLVKVNANYDLGEAMNDINTIVSDDDFVNQLPENEEAAYEVTSDDTDFDVNPCEDFTCEDSLKQMIYDSFQLSLQLKVIDMAGPYDMYGGPANSFGNIPFCLDCIISILTNSLIDMGCASIPGFELMTDEIQLGSGTSDCAFAVGLIDGYLSSLNIVYDCLSQGGKSKLGQHLSQIEDTLRWLKQECK